ncbi:molybdopterin-dependent oxidoreductase [Chloroflexota bacterium]
MKLVWTMLGAVAIIVLGGCAPGFEPPPGEVEATEFMGTELTPIRDQSNNAIKGTQHLDRDSYRLVVDGEVDNVLSLSYADLSAYPSQSRLLRFDCVEGWGFTAKWTGPRLLAILEDAGIRPGVSTVIFHSADDYSTALEMEHVREKDTIIALRLNDITMPADRGFPFQVVAESKYGYKWAKWVTRIELSSVDYKGYWEQRGYSNNADVGGPAFE